MPGASVDELRDLFVRLAGIRSPSGEERAIAEYVKEYVAGLGFEAQEDATAVGPEASGNLLVRVPGGEAGVPIALCAHLDTVPLERAPVVICENGVVRTDGQTILGADDKAAVTVLLLLLRELAEHRPAADVEILFTAGEEVGLRGAKAFDISRLAAKVVFIFDSSGEPGTAIAAAPTHKLVAAEFLGVAAHAGMAPADGRSAILAAARAIVALPQGPVDEETTVNVGVISGGVATNIVPDRCALRAEARSRDDAKVAAVVREMIETLTLAASETGIDVDISVHDHYFGYRHRPRSLPMRLAAAAAADAGLVFKPLEGNGGSDANVFNHLGLPSLTLGVGYERVHSPQEHMRLDRLAQVYALAEGLVRVAGAAGV